MIFSSLRNIFFRSSTLENPSVPLSAGADWLYDALGALRAGSGVRVSRETALTYAAVWRAVSLISRDIAKLPLGVQKWQKPGWQMEPEHPAHWLIAKRPNTELLAFPFWQTLVYHTLLSGNGYAYIFRAEDGTPDELIILNPDQTYPIRENGVLWYITETNGTTRKLDPSNVLHIKGMGYDGLAGYSVVSKGRESIGLGLAQTRYASVFFRNNAQPSVVLEHPGTLSDQALKNLMASWNAMQGGIDNAHKPKILEENMKLKQLSINARDAQLIETRQFEIREVANWFNLPPHKLGDNSRLAYNSLEQENQSYLDDALEPWLINIEQECDSKLLTEKQNRKGTHRVYYNRRRLIHADLKARVEYWTGMVNNGLANPDMVAEEEGWNPLPNDIGKKYRIPANILLLDENGEPQLPPQPEQEKKPGDKTGDSARAHRDLLMDVATRMCKRIAVHARKAAKTPTKFNDWLDRDMELEHRQVLTEAFEPIIRAVNCTSGGVPTSVHGVVGVLLNSVKHDLNDLSSRLTVLDFEEGVDKYMTEFEKTAPQGIADQMILQETRYRK